MKTKTNTTTIGSLGWALGGKFIAIAIIGWVATASAQEVTQQKSTVEIGIGHVNSGSFKASEFNGIRSDGRFPAGNFALRGGGAYDSGSALRWRFSSVDSGLQSRSVNAEFGVQGKFRFSAEYLGLRRNRSDSFQTPYQGAGTDVLTLPANWQVPNVPGVGGSNVNSARGLVKSILTAPIVDTVVTSPTLGGLLNPTSNQIARSASAADADLSLFRTVNLWTKRNRVDFLFNYQFSERWGFDVDVRPEHKKGMKPLGVTSRATGGDIAAIIPEPIDANHTQVTTNLNFKGTKANFQAGYYGSFYRNDIRSISFNNWAIGPTSPLNTMSSSPNSDFSQINLSAGYAKSPHTRLVVSGSVGQNTQDDTFVKDQTSPVVPINSMNGLVITTAFDAKFSTRLKKLNLSAGYKYNDRDNRTAVHIFQFMDADQPIGAPNPSFPAGPKNPLGPVLANNAAANRAISKTQNQIKGDVDYYLTPRQRIELGYEFQKSDYVCHGTWITCANAETTSEHLVRGDWRTHFGTSLTAKAGYSYSWRRMPSYNENAFLALVPYANVSPVAATDGQTLYGYMRDNGLNGWGPSLPFAVTTGNANVFFPANSETHAGVYAYMNRISELPGLRRYEVADRDRGKLRTSLDWQAGEHLSFQGGVDLNLDNYPNSRYGLLDGKTLGANIDGTYSLESASVNVFYTFEDLVSKSAGNTFTVNSNATNLNGATLVSGNDCNNFTTLQQRNNNAKLDPCLDWSTRRRDEVHSAGFGLTKNAGPVTFETNFVVSLSDSTQTATGGNYVNNLRISPGASPATIASFYVKATPLPAVRTNSAEVVGAGTYAIRTGQSVRFEYGFQRMNSDDWMYEGMQVGEGLPTNVLPTNENRFKYGVHAFRIGYLITF